MTNKEIRETVLSILEDLCGDSIVRESGDLNLLTMGLLDSLDYVSLQIEIEDQLGVVLPPSEYTREDLDTPDKIVAAVAAKKMA